MRYVRSAIFALSANAVIFLSGISSGPAAAQEKKEAPKLAPIAEIKLDRKEPVSYEKDIEPIFANKCMYCHSGNVVEGKFDMSNHEKLMKGGKRGVAIVAGKSSESVLYHFSSRQKTPVMPPKNEEPLTPQELALLKLWIDQGAKPPMGERVKPKIVVGLPPAIVKPIRAIAISPDKATLVSGRGNQIHLFNAATGAYIKPLLDTTLATADKKPVSAAHISLVESMAFAPDGKTLATGSFQEITLWEMEKGTVKQKLPGFADRVVALTYSSDGKYLAVGGGAPTEDGELKILDAATGKLVVEMKSGHSDTVFGVSFSPDNKMLASCGADKFVKIWEIPSGKFVKSFEGHTHHVLGVGWKPDGKFLASGGADNNVKVWNYETGEQARTINAHQKQVTSLTFVGKTPTFITTSGDQQVKLWNVDNGGTMRSFAGGTDFIYAVAASVDGKIVATGGEEGVVRLYNGDSGALVKALYPAGEEPKKEEPKKEEPKKK